MRCCQGLRRWKSSSSIPQYRGSQQGRGAARGEGAEGRLGEGPEHGEAVGVLELPEKGLGVPELGREVQGVAQEWHAMEPHDVPHMIDATRNPGRDFDERGGADPQRIERILQEHSAVATAPRAWEAAFAQEDPDIVGLGARIWPLIPPSRLRAALLPTEGFRNDRREGEHLVAQRRFLKHAALQPVQEIAQGGISPGVDSRVRRDLVSADLLLRDDGYRCGSGRRSSEGQMPCALLHRVR